MEDERRKDLPRPIDASAPRYATYKIPTVPYLPGLGTERPAEGEMLVPFERSRVLPWEKFGESELFRHGVDLYNQACFWEAHEAWEQLWQVCPASPLRLGLQGLIQLAAALLKEHEGVPTGAKKLSSAGVEKLERARDAAAPLPLDLDGFITSVREHFERGGPRPPIRLMEAPGRGAS